MSKQTFKMFGSRLEWLLILLTVLVVQPAKAQGIPNSNGLANRLRAAKTLQQAKPPKVTRILRQLSEVEPFITNAQMLLVQAPTPNNSPIIGGEVVQVTSVKANPMNKGVDVILQTSQGEQLQVTNRSTGNNFIADIPNARYQEHLLP